MIEEVNPPTFQQLRESYAHGAGPDGTYESNLEDFDAWWERTLSVSREAALLTHNVQFEHRYARDKNDPVICRCTCGWIGRTMVHHEHVAYSTAAAVLDQVKKEAENNVRA